MDSRYISEQQPLVGARVVGPGFGCRAGRSVIRDNRVPAAGTVGPAPACANGPVFYKCRADGGCARGTGPSAGGRMFHDAEKTLPGDHKDSGSSGILKRASPTHCPAANGQSPGGFVHLDLRNPGKQAEPAHGLRAAQGRSGPRPSSHIPVPRNRYGGDLLLIRGAVVCFCSLGLRANSTAGFCGGAKETCSSARIEMELGLGIWRLGA
uniref:uncharacterized protein LOC120813549 n=1 Tax=Gasterosteus aculeatus aculeatus TaxID=481459 RepID=UPI001A980A2F|nr:uncharacterized protein LOC120813549 [Gasterosteus aculeatus aculeatus]